MSATSSLGVVVPTLNEGSYLGALLDALEGVVPRAAVVVADGGSTDGTRQIAQRRGVRVIDSSPGRARQMNAGATALTTDWVWFLHADSRLGEGVADALRGFLDSAPASDVAGAYFRFGIDDGGGLLELVELGQKIRERITGLVYGDQGLLVRRSHFEAIGGYPDQPLMEDVELVRRLRRRGRLVALPGQLLTSGRRYKREGVGRASLRNLALITAYHLGVPAAQLARWYPAETGTEHPGRRILLVFAKLPEPGKVKTRLAKTMGAARAAEIYSRLARGVVTGVRSGSYRTVVCYDPPDREAEVTQWLDGEGLSFWPQGPGDLGTRMSLAFERAFQEADEVCIIGTDAPDVDRGVVESAFAELSRAPIVLGPALDGGYYLLALAAPQRELFSGIEWSTARVAQQTRQKAEALGLSVRELPALADVDEPADLPKDLVV